MNVTHFKSLIGHQSPVYHIQIIDQNNILSCDGNGFIIKWDIKSGKGNLFAKCDKSVYSFLKTENLLLIGDISGFIHFIDYQGKSQFKKMQISAKEIFAIQYSDVHNQFYIADGEGKLTILNAHFELIHQTQLSNNRLRSISISNCNYFLYLGSSDGFVYQYSISNKELTNTYPLHQNSIFTTLFIKKTLLSGGRGAKLISFNTEKESVLNTIDAHLNTINQLSLSECKKYVFSVSRDKSIKIWASNSLQLLKVINSKKFPTHINRSINTVTSVQNFIITAGDDKKIVFWQMN